MTPRPRVLLIAHGYSEPTLREQVAALRAHVDVTLVAPRRSRALVFEDVRVHDDDLTVTYPRISLSAYQYLLRTPTLGLRARPDVVHVDYDVWSSIYWQARLLAWLWSRGTVVVVGVKKNTFRRYPGWRGAVKRAIARLGARGCDHVVAASGMAAAMVTRELGVPASRVSVVTHVGVDPAQFAPSPSRTGGADEVVVGYCGRLAAHKGLLDLVAAVEQVRATGRRVRVRLLGAGDLEDRLRLLARDRPWLEVLAPVPVAGVPAFLAGLDAYVLPARVLPDHEEHDGHALLQAMSCGLPVLATRSGIVPEILSDRVTGMLAPPDDPAGLAAVLLDLLDDPALRARLGAAARDEVLERYAVEVVARAKAQAYTTVLGGVGAAAR